LLEEVLLPAATHATEGEESEEIGMIHYITIDDHRKDRDTALKAHVEALEVARQLMLYHANFACVHDSKTGYCDNCPVSDIGGAWKAEIRPSHDYSRLLCTKTRYYSK
jgi:fructose 1,6-bisphosphatase